MCSVYCGEGDLVLYVELCGWICSVHRMLSNQVARNHLFVATTQIVIMIYYGLYSDISN